MKINSYRELEVWREAVTMAVDCYRLTDTFPRHELYGLASQLQRAAVSVPANIAEGHGRWSRKEFVRFLSIAHGSLAELETHLNIAAELDYLQPESLEAIWERTARVGRMLHGLRRALERSSRTVVPDPRTPDKERSSRSPAPDPLPPAKTKP